jgi:hypothetical protein
MAVGVILAPVDEATLQRVGSAPPKASLNAAASGPSP